MPPFADDLARRIQASANDVVRQSFAGQRHDLGPDHVAIGRPILARPPDQLGAFSSRQLDGKRTVPRHDVPLPRTALTDSPGQRPQNTSPYLGNWVLSAGPRAWKPRQIAWESPRSTRNAALRPIGNIDQQIIFQPVFFLLLPRMIQHQRNFLRKKIK